MVNEFIIKNKKKIACCIIDNHSRLESNWAKEISINITDYLIHRFTKYNFDVFISEDEDDILYHVADLNFYSHAVVIASGTSTGLSDRLFQAIDDKCNEDFFIAGHILERGEDSYWKNGYYELHHQFYIVNLKEYIEIGKPFTGEMRSEQHIQIKPVRSEENLHGDNEIPLWIKQGSIEKTYDMKCHGWNIISEALKNDKKLVDLGSNIRNNKNYFYYEYDHVFLKLITQAYHDQFFVNNFFPSWNSDSIPDSIPFNGPLEQYITVGIGLNWAINVFKLGFTDNTRIVFTDINQNTLKFMKTMVEEWDGNDFHLFYKENMSFIPNGFYRNVDNYIQYTKDEWEKFLENYPNWKSIWGRIKNLAYDYILIDYMSVYDLSWIDINKKTLINLSDVFTHSPYTPFQSYKYRIACENRLIKNLYDIDPNIHLMVTSRAADGYHPDSKRIMSNSVDNFDLTDINDLIKPPWHYNDWNSPRMLF